MEILIIGGGAVVKEYYLPAINYLNINSQVTITEPNLAVANYYKELGFNTYSLDFESFFKQNKTKFDFAIITAPNHLHEAAIKCCLKNNIKVLCEKPISLSTESCDRIEKQQIISNSVVYAAMVRRYLPSFQAMEKSLHLLGVIQNVEIEDGTPFAWKADSYAFFDPKNGGVLADMGVHYLDLVYKLFGELTPVKYNDDYEGGVEANSSYQLKSKKDFKISINLSRTQTLKNHFKIIGSSGSIWINKDEFDACYFSDNNGLTHKIEINNAFKDSALAYTFESCFVEQITCLLSGDSNLVDITQAKHVTFLIEWAYKNRVQNIPVKNDNPYFITGATGFIGTALIERLWFTGNQNITAPVRNYKTCAPIARFDIKLPRLDLLNYQAVTQSLKGQKFVVHMAYATDGKDAFSINVEATKNVVKAACEQGAEAIVVMSTMNVYGFPDGEVTENAKYKPAGGSYGETKKIMQQWCLDFAKTQTKTRIIVLNPTCVYGPNGKTYTNLPAILLKSNRFCWIDEGAGMANLVFIDNLIDAIEMALQAKEAHAQNFIITDGAVTWKYFLSKLLSPYDSTIKNLSTAEISKGSFESKSDLKSIFRYLLTNYELVSLINNHPILGKIKKFLFSKAPGFRNKLDDQREIEWNSSSSINLTKIKPEKFNPPVWLKDLFGFNKSHFLSNKAKKTLNWNSKIDIETGIKKTKEWLDSQY
nr:NAD-dependent epimerase/dehydratase family protein [Pedobacter sp. ASV2]